MRPKHGDLKNKSFTKIKYSDKTNASIPLQFKLTKFPVDLRSYTNGNVHSITFGSFRSYSINWLFYGIYYLNGYSLPGVPLVPLPLPRSKNLLWVHIFLSSHSLSLLGSLVSTTDLAWGAWEWGQPVRIYNNSSLSVHQNSNMTPWSSRQDWKFLKILLIPISLIWRQINPNQI